MSLKLNRPVDGFVRDPNNKGAVVNVDYEGLKAYKRQKNKFREMDQMKEKVAQLDSLRGEVTEIKGMLKELMERIAR